MNLKTLCLLLLLTTKLDIIAQVVDSTALGKVTYITSKNVYVKFNSTNTIEIGDTLFHLNQTDNNPCLKVIQKSSSSCVCTKIENCSLNLNDMLYLKTKNNIIDLTDSLLTNNGVIKNDIEEIDTTKVITKVKLAKSKYKQKISARISSASYSLIPDNEENQHRVMQRLILRAYNIKDTKYSFESYINYRQNLEANTDNSNEKTKFLRIYNLALSYDIDSTLKIVLGRKINYKVSSLGALDGLQIEKTFGNYYTGIVIGYKPDFNEYSINTDQLQYGGYFGTSFRSKKLFSQSTLGLLEQKKGGSIDRRYSHFQHSSTINRKLNIFSSFELDLYSKINGISSSNIRLSNFYISTRYRFSRKVNITLSYDSRKRIIYYETFKTEIEELLDEDIARQGFRLRLSLKPIKHINLSLAYSKRFQSDQQNNSENFQGSLNLSKIPYINGTLSLTVNKNTSNYLISNIYSVRHNRTMIPRKLNAMFSLRKVNYNYINSELISNQLYYSVNLRYRINKKLTFSIMVVKSTRDNSASTTKFNKVRINTKIIKRFRA